MSPVLPGAEPFDHAGGPVGVLLCHGFTGTPQTLRGWADYLAGQGLTVSLPRLPGHGTTWQDLARTGGDDWFAEIDAAFGKLASRCEQVFVFGLSMGGCLALRLAETRGDAVRGLVLVNPSLAPDTRLFLLAPVLKYVLRSLPGIASDIKKPGGHEIGYDRVPVRAAATLPKPGTRRSGTWARSPSRCSSTGAPPITSSARPACGRCWPDCPAAR